MKNDIIKSRAYAVTLDGQTYTMRAELHKSGAFQYGNGTTLVLYDGVNTAPWVYDTRYETGIVRDWCNWCDTFVSNWCDKDAVINVTE